MYCFESGNTKPGVVQGNVMWDGFRMKEREGFEELLRMKDEDVRNGLEETIELEIMSQSSKVELSEYGSNERREEWVIAMGEIVRMGSSNVDWRVYVEMLEDGGASSIISFVKVSLQGSVEMVGEVWWMWGQFVWEEREWFEKLVRDGREDGGNRKSC